MEEGFVLMNLSKYIGWRALLHRVTAKQQSKREQTHSASLHVVEKCEKVEGVNTQNDYETTSKRGTKRKKTCPLCFLNLFKFQENKFKIVPKNF